MRFRVLGCSGGLGKTSCFLLDQDVLIDIGTGMFNLNQDELLQIRHVLISHAHFDHLVGLPFLAEHCFRHRQTFSLYGLPETLVDIKQHIFNWRIWPDFSRLPESGAATVRLVEIEPGQSLEIDGRTVMALPAAHTVPALGFAVTNQQTSWVYSGDTTSCPGFWSAIQALPRLSTLIVDLSFSNQDAGVAGQSKHYYSAQFIKDLRCLPTMAEVYVTHFKPGCEEDIMQELLAAPCKIRRLYAGDEFWLAEGSNDHDRLSSCD